MEEAANARAQGLCGAKARTTGNPCRCRSVKGRNRCRYHGGAKGSGGPKGEANGSWKHGGFTGDAVELRRSVSRLLKAVREEPDAEPSSPLGLADLLALLGVKLSRADRRERNKAAWQGGDRTKWGGERRKRDPRRGWRNHRQG